MSEVRQVVVSIPGGPALSPAKDVALVLWTIDLAAGATTALGDSDTIALAGARTLMLSAYVEYHAAAVAGARLHIMTAYLDLPAYYDTIPWDSWDMEFVAGGALQQSVNYDVCPAFIKLQIENLDAAQVIPYMDIVATVGA